MAAGIGALSLAGAVWFTADGAGLLHAAVYACAILPGLPLGVALLGRHPLGWFGGAALGYAVTALALWGATALGAASGWAFTGAWALGVLGAWSATRFIRAPVLTVPAWRGPDTWALLFVVLLALLIFVFPYRNLGRADGEGTTHYRAYFTADFVWHVALTAELAKLERPPRNPYLGDRPVHYYWTYFQLPAVVAAAGPPALRDIERVLKANAICTGVLMIAVFALVVWCAVPRAVPMALAVTLAAVAASAEGSYILHGIWSRGASLAELRHLNIDAISNWHFRGLRIDGIPRSMWYTPQHAMSMALGVLALPVAAGAGIASPLAAIAAAGVFLGASTLFNPLLGGMLSLVYGLVIVGDALRRPRTLARLPLHAVAALPVALAIAWSASSLMFEGAGGAVQFGVAGFARNAPVRTLFLSLGPLLLVAAAGLWPPWRLPRAMGPALAGIGVGLLVLYGVRLSVEESYVGFRAGQVLQATLPILAARAFARGWESPRLAVPTLAVAIAVVAVGLPTTVIDTFNAQDTANRAMGPGFRWTISVPRAEQEALAWLRRATPPDAVVQADATARARETWTQIPTFGQRRMAAGLPISLLNMPEYAERSTRVHRDVFGTADARVAWDTCRAMGIGYVYVGDVERAAHPADALAKFDAMPQFFQRVFGNEAAAIYVVAHP